MFLNKICKNNHGTRWTVHGARYTEHGTGFTVHGLFNFFIWKYYVCYSNCYLLIDSL